MDRFKRVGDWVLDKDLLLDFEDHRKAAARKTQPSLGGIRIHDNIPSERVGVFRHVWVQRGFVITGVRRRRLGNREIREITQERTRNRILRLNPGL